jgi:hypothetical protein
MVPKFYGYQLDKNPECCKESTECVDKRITKIIMSGYKLNGYIPQEIDQLNALQGIYLPFNNLKGPIPASVGNLRNLKWVELQSNRFEGEIPQELGKLSNLVDLKLNDNKLSGFVPADLGNLKNLTQLFLQDNHLKGKLPFISSVANSTYVFEPQTPLPEFSPVVVPALVSGGVLLAILGAIMFTVYRNKKNKAEQTCEPAAVSLSNSVYESDHRMSTDTANEDEVIVLAEGNHQNSKITSSSPLL